MGYIASGKVGVYPGPAGSVQLRVYIQGNVADPDLMEARLEELLATVPDLLQKISLDEVQERAQGVSAGLEETPTSAHVEVSQFWQAIHDESECFDRAENQANFLKKTDSSTLRTALVDVFNAFWNVRRTKATVKIFKSEGSNGAVPDWTKEKLKTSLGENASGLIDTIATERAQTTVIGTISKKDREDVFKTALNHADPLWEPVIAACEIV
jgi:secreted Zn-dependent insulinase-like peptidase